ncbi:hypothetical protein ACFRAR_14755 [Kitasatospora sp. NPDC056651]|uniref:hypothetical protein n=1 Tax=Kitasatospora sp. NPDC056651 TaxID=3345892 RepID=UPI003692FBBA
MDWNMIFGGISAAAAVGSFALQGVDARKKRGGDRDAESGKETDEAAAPPEAGSAAVDPDGDQAE